MMAASVEEDARYVLDRFRLEGKDYLVSLVSVDGEEADDLLQTHHWIIGLMVPGQYFAALASEIERHEGIIDKFIGDAVMAIWNAPVKTQDHPLKACRAAWSCVEALERLFDHPTWEGHPKFPTRFGLHSDEVLIGHFGAPQRMDYTSLGDGVNLAARLEGLNKQYGTRILVSQSVYEVARQEFRFRRLDRVAVKGKTRGVEVYELLGPLGQPVAPYARMGRHVSSFFQVVLLLAWLCSGGLASEQLLVVASNDHDSVKDVLSLELNQDNQPVFLIHRQAGQTYRYDVAQIREGITLRQQRGRDVVRLKAVEFSPEQGGQFQLTYLIQAVPTQQYGSLVLDLRRSGPKWQLYHAQRAVNSFRFLVKTLSLVGPVGIRAVQLNR